MKITCKVGIVKIYLKKNRSTFKIGIRICTKRLIFFPHPAWNPITNPKVITRNSANMIKYKRVLNKELSALTAPSTTV